MDIELRPYQDQAMESVRDAFRRGAKSVLISAATGSGKTVLASAFMAAVMDKGNRATFTVDRLSLIDQTSKTFDRYGLRHGVIQSQHPRWQPHQPVQICSVQTLARREWPESDLDVIDEAHVLHAIHKNRIKSGESRIIGLTATPFTKGLAKYFDAVVNVTTTRKLIEDGYLVPYRIFSCAEPDMAGVAVKSTGEWDDRQASDKALEVVGDVVQEYLKHGEDRKFICSAVDTNHVEELARQFLAAGINVATYTYKDKDEDRQETVNEFRKVDSVIRGLITVTAASRGFDIPDVSCVIMARPLRKSLAEHIQLFGRGLRISPETEKFDCIVLDHSGNCARFFADCEAFFDFGISELDDGKPKPKPKAQEKKEKEPVKCPQCRALHNPMPFCPNCGHEYPRQAAIAHVPGTLKEMIAGQHRQALTDSVWPEICGYVLQRREGEAARKQALAIFKEMTGVWPQQAFELTQPKDPSPEVLGKIKHQQIKWAHRRKKRQAA